MLDPVINTSAAATAAPEFAEPAPPGGVLDAQGPGAEPFAALPDGARAFHGGGSDWQRRFNDIFGAPDHRLYDTQGPQGNPGTQLKAPPAPAVPGKPLDVQTLEKLNQTAQGFFKRNTVPSKGYDELRQDLAGAQAHFKAATEALKAGDYPKAEKHLRALGFPLPAPGAGVGMVSHELTLTAILLGHPVKFEKNDAWTPQGGLTWGKGGKQELNDLQGYAVNAALVNRLAAARGGVSNPPTEAQLVQYMTDLAHPAKGGKAPAAKDVMEAASQITNGMIVHYSSVAGVRDPVYGANPNTRHYFKDDSGRFHEFASQQEAMKAANAGGKPVTIRPLPTHSPDAWSDIASPGMRAGRYIGDCESKVYLQTRLLTSAGFTSLGSVDVQNTAVGHGHMFGVFKAPDGTIWVTSNEAFSQVKASDPKAGVTQADLDSTLKAMTAEVFHVEPNFKGETDLSDFRFATAATANLSGSNAAVDSIRRSSELNQMGRTEALIAPPPPKPAKP
jgi:hypothetical protein